MDYPKLRSIDIFPFEASGQKAIGLRDPAVMNDRVLVISYPAFFIVSLFDGTRSLMDIKAEYMRKYGEIIFTEQLEEMVKQLDENYLLESERYQTYRAQMEDEFRRAEIRDAAYAGKSYEAEPGRLTEQINGFFTDPGGPGMPGPEKAETPVKGLIAPHIDFQRGGPCYAWAYKELAESPPPDLFIILGTVHLPTLNPFILTDKQFATPFGVVDTASDIIDALAENVSFDPFQDEILHKTEHTIEFQAVFLSYLFRENPRFRIVPILCGSFHDVIAGSLAADQKPHLSDFIACLREAVGKSGCQSCYVASADLAHVGQRFGADAAPSAADLRDVEQQDRAMLSHAERLDAEGFCNFIQRERDRRNICGLPPIYTLLSAMDAQEGKLLDYRQAVEPEGGSAVTFTSMVFR
jgi:AmmeMemoRadiSam system protein B